MNPKIASNILSAVRALSAAVTKRYSAATRLTRYATELERTVPSLLSETSSLKLSTLVDDFSEVQQTITFLVRDASIAKEVALKASEHASQVADDVARLALVYRERLASNAAQGAAQVDNSVLKFLDDLSLKAKLYAESEKLTVEAATRLAEASVAAQEAGEALSRYVSQAILNGKEELSELENLANRVVEATEEVYEAAYRFDELSNSTLFASQRLANVKEGAISLSTILAVIAERMAENVAGNDDLAAGTYEQVSLDGLGIAAAIQLGIIASPYIAEGANQLGKKSIDIAMAAGDVGTAIGKIPLQGFYYLTDQSPEKPVPQKINTNRDDEIQLNEALRKQNMEAVWTKAARGSLPVKIETETENYTPDFSQEIYESIDPSLSQVSLKP